MKLLRNFDNAKIYLDLETSEILKTREEPDIVGWYKIIEDNKCGILVEDRKICIFYNDNKIVIEIGFLAKIMNSEKLNYKYFILNNGKRDVLRFMYNFEKVELNIAPSSFMSQEDFDWGLFLERIINNTSRREDFIEIWSQ